MKAYRTTIIALVLIVVMIGGYIALKSMGVFEKPADTKATEAPELETGYIFEFPAGAEFAKIECYTNDDIVLEKEQDIWKCTSYEDLTISTGNVAAIIAAMKNIRGTVVFKGTVDDSVKTTYALSETESVTVTLRSGEVFKLLFGTTNMTGSSYFVHVVDSDKVFLLSSTYKNTVLITKADLISSDIFVFDDTGKIRFVEISRKNEKVAELTAEINEDLKREWTLQYPLKRSGNDEYLESFLTSVLAVSIYASVESNCEDLSKYGLDVPSYKLIVKDNKKTITFCLGNKTPDAGSYYCVIGEGSKDVYTVETTAITFKDDKVTKYMQREICLIDYWELATVDIELFGKSYKLEYHADVEDTNNEEFKINGLNTKIGENDCRKAFKKIGTSMYSIAIDDLELTPAHTQEIICKIVYTKSDGSVLTLECYKRDDYSMSYYLNGEYVGGYGKIGYLTASATNYGLEKTIEALFIAMGVEDSN